VAGLKTALSQIKGGGSLVSSAVGGQMRLEHIDGPGDYRHDYQLSAA